MKVLVTGANGQLGSEIKRRHEIVKNTRFIFTDIDELDLSDTNKLEQYLNAEKPDYLINCAAYTSVDKAETELKAAKLLNTTIPAVLARLTEKTNTRLIHISTDYVFDGNGNIPLKESDSTNPESVYGNTKFEGEQEVLKYDHTLIVRTTWLYSVFGHNFVKTILKYGKERDELRVVFDQTGSPTYAGDLADALLSIINHSEQTGNFNSGIYHFSNEGVCSWYDFALAIANYSELDCRITPIETHEYPLPAKRPAYSVFNKKKIKSVFNLEIPHWQKSLHTVLDELIKKN